MFTAHIQLRFGNTQKHSQIPTLKISIKLTKQLQKNLRN